MPVVDKSPRRRCGGGGSGGGHGKRSYNGGYSEAKQREDVRALHEAYQFLSRRYSPGPPPLPKPEDEEYVPVGFRGKDEEEVGSAGN